MGIHGPTLLQGDANKEAKGDKVSITDPRPPPPADPELITFSEAMARLSVSRRTLYNWKEKGLIDVVYRPSGTPRIVAASLAPRLTKRRCADSDTPDLARGRTIAVDG